MKNIGGSGSTLFDVGDEGARAEEVEKKVFILHIGTTITPTDRTFPRHSRKKGQE